MSHAQERDGALPTFLAKKERKVGQVTAHCSHEPEAVLLDLVKSSWSRTGACRLGTGATVQ